MPDDTHMSVAPYDSSVATAQGVQGVLTLDMGRLMVPVTSGRSLSFESTTKLSLSFGPGDVPHLNMAQGRRPTLLAPAATLGGPLQDAALPPLKQLERQPERPLQTTNAARPADQTAQHNAQAAAPAAPRETAQVEAEVERRTALTDEETGKDLPIDYKEVKIQKQELYTTWYSTNAKHPIRAPRAGLHVEHGYLYLHRAEGELCMWMWLDDEQVPRVSDELTTSNERGRWERVHSGHAHPSLEGLWLHVLEGDKPSWAGKKAAMEYQRKMRAKANLKKHFALTA